MKLKKLFSLVGASFVGIHLINKYTTTHAKSLLNFNVYRDSTYKWQYGNIFYSKKGHGAPLLFIHDLDAGSSSYEWLKLVDHYAKTNTVYLIDLIGCGSSEKPNFNYTNYLFTKLVRDFIKDVIQEPCTVITSGSSSSIALMTTLSDENNITNIVMINPIDSNHCKYIPANNKKAFLFRLPVIGTFLANHYNTREHYETLFYTKYYKNPYNINPKDIDAYYSSYHTGIHCSKAIYASICNLYTNVDITSALQNISIPLSIICGDNIDNLDNIIDSYLTYIPTLKSEIIEDTKYLPHMENPEAVINVLDKLIQ